MTIYTHFLLCLQYLSCTFLEVCVCGPDFVCICSISDHVSQEWRWWLAPPPLVLREPRLDFVGASPEPHLPALAPPTPGICAQCQPCTARPPYTGSTEPTWDFFFLHLFQAICGFTWPMLGSICTFSSGPPACK